MCLLSKGSFCSKVLHHDRLFTYILDLLHHIKFFFYITFVSLECNRDLGMGGISCFMGSSRQIGNFTEFGPGFPFNYLRSARIDPFSYFHLFGFNNISLIVSLDQFFKSSHDFTVDHCHLFFNFLNYINNRIKESFYF